MWTLSWKRDHSHKEVLPLTTSHAVLKVGCIPRHSQLPADTSVGDNHLFSVLHPTPYSRTGWKKQSRRNLLDWSGMDNIRYKVSPKSKGDLSFLQIIPYINESLKTVWHLAPNVFCIVPFAGKCICNFILRIAQESCNSRFLLSGTKLKDP